MFLHVLHILQRIFRYFSFFSLAFTIFFFHFDTELNLPKIMKEFSINLPPSPPASRFDLEIFISIFITFFLFAIHFYIIYLPCKKIYDDSLRVRVNNFV